MAWNPIALQDALSVQYKDASTADKLMVVYGAMLENIAAAAQFSSLVNRNYSTAPVAGGSVNVKRLAFATVRTYGTARAANKGDKLVNNGTDILINQQVEIVEEIENKDLKWYYQGGEASLLAMRAADHMISIANYLDRAYFVQAQTDAPVFDTSPYTGIQNQIIALIEKLEAVVSENIDIVDRSMMVLTLAPKWYDALQSYLLTLPNPYNGGQNAKYFMGVECQSAPRQGVDALIQLRGAVAMPFVIDNYAVNRIPLSNSFAEELYMFFGIKTIMSDVLFKAALGTDNNISA